MHEERVFGEFVKEEEDIRKAVEDIRNIYAIPGFDFVPQNEKIFCGFKTLHPNDDGFEYYFENLYDKIKSHI